MLILDDDPLHRNYMRELLTQQIADELLIEEAENAEEALRYFEVNDPELSVFDLQLPGKSGIDVAVEVWQRNATQKILFWSQHADELYVRKLFSKVPEEAIYGFLTKTTLEGHIINAIQSILDFEQCWIDPKIRKVKQTTFDKTTGVSDVEYETLVDLALGLSDKAIAERRFITRRGVQNRLSSLYAKLGVGDEQVNGSSLYSPRSRAIALALIRGLINQTSLEIENEYLQKWIKNKN